MVAQTLVVTCISNTDLFFGANHGARRKGAKKKKRGRERRGQQGAPLNFWLYARACIRYVKALFIYIKTQNPAFYAPRWHCHPLALFIKKKTHVFQTGTRRNAEHARWSGVLGEVAIENCLVE